MRQADLISLVAQDDVKETVWPSVFGLWDVVNALVRLRPSPA